MDDLEFRRTVLADPNTREEAIVDAINGDAAKQQFLDDVHTLDAKIKRAVDVEVPDNLASKLMQQAEKDVSSNGVDKVSERSEAANDASFWKIAVAACFAFVIGLSVNLSSLQPDSGLGAGEYAMKYTYQGMQNVEQLDEQLPLHQVNAKLASYGVQMEQDIGAVYYADSYFCNYNDVEVLRLVVGGEAGNISLFVLPKNNKLKSWNEFGDERFNGKATRYSKADVVIVGEKAEPLRAFQSKVENSMKWI